MNPGMRLATSTLLWLTSSPGSKLTLTSTSWAAWSSEPVVRRGHLFSSTLPTIGAMPTPWVACSELETQTSWLPRRPTSN
jgi:hypothetical protein